MKKVYVLSFVALLLASKATLAEPAAVIVKDKLPDKVPVYCTLAYTIKDKLFFITPVYGPLTKNADNRMPLQSLQPVTGTPEKVILLATQKEDFLPSLLNKSLRSLRTNRDVEFKAWSLDCAGDIICTILPGRIGKLRIKIDKDADCPSVATRTKRTIREKVSRKLKPEPEGPFQVIDPIYPSPQKTGY